MVAKDGPLLPWIWITGLLVTGWTLVTVPLANPSICLHSVNSMALFSRTILYWFVVKYLEYKWHCCFQILIIDSWSSHQTQQNFLLIFLLFPIKKGYILGQLQYWSVRVLIVILGNKSWSVVTRVPRTYLEHPWTVKIWSKVIVPLLCLFICMLLLIS